MKLIIQIPCYNEEKTLPLVFKDLPKKIKGIRKIETQIIDDGSTDKTYQVAKRLKVDHIIRFKQNKGLAAAFKAGVDHALVNGADILVNTDGDNQYRGQDISKLVKPILKGKADIVIGCRPIDNHPEFSWAKKKLQKFGSWVLRKLSRTDVEDASSGFRAYNKEAMLRINVFSSFSYCMETLIQAGLDNLKTTSIKIRVNPKIRESRLFKTPIDYLWQSGKTIINIFLLYRSSQFFSLISLLFLLFSLILVVRYLILTMIKGASAGSFWPSIILAGILLMASSFVYLTGVLASLIAANRKLSEEILFRLRKVNFDKSKLKLKTK